MTATKIQWTDKVWNPVRGCAKVSAGCANCYAERVAGRFGGHGQPYEGLVMYRSQCSGLLYENPKAAGTSRAEWRGTARFVPEMLAAPLSWRKPCRVFVNSMSDLFHKDITNEQIAAVFGVMATCPQHTFQVLTKRPERMVEWFEWLMGEFAKREVFWIESVCLGCARNLGAKTGADPRHGRWPLPNVHLGVSVENQAAADERIPLLLQCPAAVRWVSCEPLLGAVDLTSVQRDANVLAGVCLDGSGDCDGVAECESLDWVVCGGESGPHARPMHPDWARSLRDQCREAGVPFWFKQWGEWCVASEENGFFGGVMPETGERFTWLGIDGQTRNPSCHELIEPYAMARRATKRNGNLLDGVRYEMRPGEQWGGES